MNDSKSRWRIKDVIVGKTLIVLICTIFVSSKFEQMALYAIGRYLEKKGRIQFCADVSCFPISFLFFTIPAFLFTIFMLQTLLNIKSLSNKKAKKKSARIIERNEKKFKWHITYSLGIGYLILVICTYAEIKIVQPMLKNRMDGTSITYTLVCLLCIAIVIITTVKLIKFINKTAIKATGTNKELLEAWCNGELVEEIPKKIRTSEDMEKITKILKACAATTLTTAVIEYYIYGGIKRIMKASAFLGAICAIIVGIFTLGFFNMFQNEMQDGIKGLSEDLCATMGSSQSVSELKNKKKLSQSLWFRKTNAEKKADFDAAMAKKKADYNPKSYEAGRSANIAFNSRMDAERASREYYKNK